MIGSPSGIMQGIASILGDVLGSTNVSIDDYEILARRSSVCAIISLEGGNLAPHQFGSFGATWSIRITLYFQTKASGGAPLRSLPLTVGQVCDALALHQDLGGEARQITRIEVFHEPGAAVESNGLVWLTVGIRVDARVF
jgi:hypothetical protein